MNKQYYVMKKLLVLALMCIMSATLWAGDKKGSFTAGDKTFLLNGEPFIVKAAEIHYPRIPREYWDHRIKMCKALGMNTVCIYIFWNIHEQKEGQFDFSDNLDLHSVHQFQRIQEIEIDRKMNEKIEQLKEKMNGAGF